MAAPGGEHARDVTFGNAGAHDIDVSREQLAGHAARRYGKHHGFDFDRRHLLSAVHGHTYGFFGLRKIDDAARLHPLCCGVPEADDVHGVAPAGQNLLRRMRAKTCDQADDLARSNIECGNEGAAPRRDRLHLRRQAVMEGVHALPPFFFLALSSCSSLRAWAAAGDIRTVTRSGIRRSITATSRDRSFLSRSSVTRRCNAVSIPISGNSTSMPLISRKFQRRCATMIEART